MVEADAAGLWSNLWPAVLSVEKKHQSENSNLSSHLYSFELFGLKTETADERCIYS